MWSSRRKTNRNEVLEKKVASYRVSIAVEMAGRKQHSQLHMCVCVCVCVGVHMDGCARERKVKETKSTKQFTANINKASKQCN